MYHYIRTNVSPKDVMGIGLSVHPDTLDSQLSTLEKDGYVTTTFSALEKKNIPSKPLIITFDDGYEDAYTQALPLLKKHKMKAVFYIITGFVGTPNYLTWKQLEEMRDAGMEIGAHTVDHKNLSTLPSDKQQKEIDDSITMLQDKLDVTVNSFAYPSGKYNIWSLNILKRAGIPFAVTTQSGIASDGYYPLQLPRVRVKDATDITSVLKEFSHNRIAHARKK